MGDRAFFWITAGILFAIAAILAVSTPIGSAPDEPVQILRAAGVVRGDIGGPSTETPSPSPDQPNNVSYIVTVPRSYAETLDLPGCYAFKPWVPASCAPSLSDDSTPTEASTYVGSYPPVVYALAGIPSLFLPAGRGVYAMRLVIGAICSVLLALGLVAARRGAGGVATSCAALTITPMALYMAGTVNPSGVEIAAAFATWLTFLDLLHVAHAQRGGPRTGVRLPIVAYAISASALIATRPSGFLIFGVITVCCLLAVWDRQLGATLLASRDARLGAGAIAAVGLLTLGWILYAHSFSSFLGFPHPELTKLDIIEHALTSHSELAREMVGFFGWLDAPVPTFVWVPWIAVASGIVVAGFVVGSNRMRLALAAAALLGVIAPPLTQVTNAQRYGYIWVGRYQLPFAMGVVLIAGWAISSWYQARRSDSGGDPRVVTWLAQLGRIGISLLAAAGLTASYVVLMQRFATGMAVGRFDYLTKAIWHPRFDPRLTTAVFIVAAIVWAGWLLTVPLRPSRASGGGAGPPVAHDTPAAAADQPG